MGRRRRRHRGRALHGATAVAAASHPVELLLGGLAGDHPICHGIGMLLVRIARRADAALELDAAPLLDHVGRLMGDGV
jgi:hypothetical protein